MGCNWSVGLALEENQRRRFNPEVPLDDVEDDDIIDANKVAHLVLMADPPDALVNHQHTVDTALVVLWPCVPNLLARVEESSHGRAYGSDAAEEG